MKVGLVSTQKFHFFDTARELKARGLLGRMVSGYPASRTAGEGLDSSELINFPFWTTLYMASNRVMQDTPVQREIEWTATQRIDRFAAKKLADCDVIMTMCCSGLIAGREVQKRGGRFFVDRPVVHIAVQDQILAAAYREAGVPYNPIDPRKIEKESQEYLTADQVLVPSRIVARTMVSQGVPESRIQVIPLGADLKLFQPEGTKSEDEIEILFAGNVTIQKGIYVLAAAVEQIKRPGLKVTLAGPVFKESEAALQRLEKACTLSVLGKLDQSELRRRMTQATMFILPSVQDGFGVVVPQALACGTPCIVSDMAGASEILVEGESGIIVESGNAASLSAAILRLMDDRELRSRLAENGASAIRKMAGWGQYGDQLERLVRAGARQAA